MNKDVLNRLKNIKLLDDSDETQFISTGCYALNKIISGNYHQGLPLGHIVQLRGESSTGKTLFVTTMLKSAQEAGWYTALLDAENTFSKQFSNKLGLDSGLLIYDNPTNLEEAFDKVQELINKIRESDKETPICIAIDSLAVLATKEESERETVGEITNTDGARRAVIIGALLRKIDKILKKSKTTLIVVNQLRSKINTSPYQNPDTNAAGGRSLEFYLSVDIKLVSNKTSDVIRDEKTKQPLGIQGDIQIKKNKVGIPFRECEFRVLFDKGLDDTFGLLDLLTNDGLITKSDSGRLSVGNTKFAKADFLDLLNDKTNPDLAIIRDTLKLKD
jgi:recombination protein RecA